MNKPARRTTVHHINERNSEATYTAWNAPVSQPDVVACHLPRRNNITIVINKDVAPQTARAGAAELDFRTACVTLAALWNVHT